MKTIVGVTWIVLVLCFLLVTQPVIAEVLTVQAQDACRTAEMDADQETSGTLWFVAGCGLGILGVIGAYVIKPSPPASKLVGKSPEYVASYSDCYQAKAKSIQTTNAWYGFGAYVVFVVIYVAVVVAAASP